MTTSDRMVELHLGNIHEVMSADDNSENRSEPTDEELDELIHDLYINTGVPREEFTEKFQTRMRDLLKILLQPPDLESSNAEPLRLSEPSQNNNA
jgi:hypothetical protein